MSGRDGCISRGTRITDAGRAYLAAHRAKLCPGCKEPRPQTPLGTMTPAAVALLRARAQASALPSDAALVAARESAPT